MDTLSTKTLVHYLAALAAPTPVPAGGSAAAVTVAQGIALITMALTVSARKNAGDQTARRLTAMAASMQSQADTALILATEDGRAFAAWLAARRLSDAASDISAAWQRTVEVPLQLCEICLAVLREVTDVVPALGAAVAPDAWAGVQLIRTGADMSLANIAVNLRMAGDDEPAATLATAARTYSSDLARQWEAAAQAFSSLHKGFGQ